MTAISFGTKFDLTSTPKQFIFNDSSDWAGQGISVGNVNGCFKITSPSGIVIYNNTDFSDANCDILIDTSLINQTTIGLALAANGLPELGAYSIQYSVYDKNLLTTYTVTTVFTNEYVASPVVAITQTVDCLSPLFYSIDATDYVVSGITPTISRTNTIDYPYGSAGEGSPTVGSAATVSTSTFYQGTQTTEIESDLIYTFGDGLIIIDTVSGVKEVVVDCKDVCGIVCCIRTLEQRMIGYATTNKTLFDETKSLFNLVMSEVGFAYLLIRCGKSDYVNAVLAYIRTIANCTEDCDCSGSEPTQVVGIGGLVNNVIVESGSPSFIVVNPVVVGNTTTYTITIDSSLVNNINKVWTQVFANDAARAAAVPNFNGQLGVQIDTDTVYESTGLSAGNWTQVNFFKVGAGVSSLMTKTATAAAGDDSIAIGNQASSAGGESVAIGIQASSAGLDSVALGAASTASVTGATSLGSGASSTALSSTAVGTSSSAQGAHSAALGEGAITLGDYSIAIGNISYSESINSIAIGKTSNTTGNDSIAIGASSSSSGGGSIAFGKSTVSNGDSSVSVGDSSASAGNNSVAVGVSSSSNGNDSVAIGVSSSSSSSSVALGNTANASGSDSISIGAASTSPGPSSIAVGESSSSVGSGSVSFGVSSSSVGSNSVALGASSTASAATSSAFGSNSQATSATSTALGAYSIASGVASTTVGYLAVARLASTVNITGTVITRKDSAESPAQRFFSGVVVTVSTPEMDLKDAGAGDYPISFPPGALFYPDSVDLVITNANTVTGQPTIRIGGDISTSSLLAAVATTALTVTGHRQRFNTLLTATGQTTVTAGVTVAATGTTLKGRFVFKGFLIENE